MFMLTATLRCLFKVLSTEPETQERSLRGPSCAPPWRKLPKRIDLLSLSPKSRESLNNWPRYDTAEETNVDSKFSAPHKAGDLRLASPF